MVAGSSPARAAQSLVSRTPFQAKISRYSVSCSSWRKSRPINIFVQFLAGPGEVRQGLIGFLLRLIAWISLLVGPIALLVFFELQFLPYHHEWISRWQRVAVVTDLLLLWVLWPMVLQGGVARGWRQIGWDQRVMTGPRPEDAHRLALLVRELDDWLVNGGKQPRYWVDQRPQTSAR
jgi:hypothetical protein